VAAAGWRLREGVESLEGATRYVITGHPGGAYEPQNVSRFNLEDSSKLVLLDKAWSAP